MKKLLVVIPMLALLSSCGHYQTEAEKEETCTNMGAPVGSTNYYDCRKTLLQNEENRKERRREAIAKMFSTEPVVQSVPQQIQQVQIITVNPYAAQANALARYPEEAAQVMSMGVR